MSRGGRGGSGRGGGRGGFGGSSSSMPPMGLTFADLANLSREQTAFYPPIDIPVLAAYTDSEKRICELQLGFASRLRDSPYYLVESTKTQDLPRYSDKYLPSAARQPTLKRKDLNPTFFPQDLFEDYFNPKKKSKVPKKSQTKVNIDDVAEDDDQQQSDAERSNNGSQGDAEDYDAEEDYGDNDYAENYFDNGEGDDMDDLGGGGDDYGGGDYD